ncbi:MAG: hypothetical protein R3F43_23810 [bacterium]
MTSSPSWATPRCGWASPTPPARRARWAATLIPPSPHHPARGDAAFLGQLPLEALELDDEVGAVLQQAGVQTVAALRALPTGSLEGRFGPAGRAAVERALAQDARRPRGSLREPLPEAVLVLEQPVDQTAPLIFGLRGLLDRWPRSWWRAAWRLNGWR